MSFSHLVLAGYWLFLACCAGYAMLRGGQPERLGGIILIAGSVLSWAGASREAVRFHGMENGILLIDLAVLAAFLTLALKSDRFWPLWVTGFHLVAVLTHLALLADPTVVPRAYALAQGFWAYPMLIALAIGTNIYRRTRGRQPASSF